MSNCSEERYGRLLSPPPPNNQSHGKLGFEEALEVKSLRRIISAYLNYSDAAEEDVQRYETCYRKLPPDHQALLSHLSSKFQRLRRCISVNSFFILNMIQAFDPPLDMSQDVDICECKHLEDVPKDCLSGERSFFSEHSSSTSGRTRPFEADQTICVRQSDPTCKALIKSTTNEDMPMISETVTGGLRESSEYRKEPESADANDVMVLNNGTMDSSTADSNGNSIQVSLPLRDCLGPSFQLNIPLVDADKVRCIVRNIVRDWAAEGQRERDQCYKPILEELDGLFPSQQEGRHPCCLVPGAGLGRLALEISCLGFITQGNEFSYYMMICSSFILNQVLESGQFIPGSTAIATLFLIMINFGPF